MFSCFVVAGVLFLGTDSRVVTLSESPQIFKTKNTITIAADSYTSDVEPNLSFTYEGSPKGLLEKCEKEAFEDAFKEVDYALQ